MYYDFSKKELWVARKDLFIIMRGLRSYQRICVFIVVKKLIKLGPNCKPHFLSELSTITFFAVWSYYFVLMFLILFRFYYFQMMRNFIMATMLTTFSTCTVSYEFFKKIPHVDSLIQPYWRTFFISLISIVSFDW